MVPGIVPGAITRTQQKMPSGGASTCESPTSCSSNIFKGVREKIPGRFGWKAEQPTVLQQAATAFVQDIGITSSLMLEEKFHTGFLWLGGTGYTGLVARRL
jgi:hypothetical protein